MGTGQEHSSPDVDMSAAFLCAEQILSLWLSVVHQPSWTLLFSQCLGHLSWGMEFQDGGNLLHHVVPEHWLLTLKWILPHPQTPRDFSNMNNICAKLTFREVKVCWCCPASRRYLHTDGLSHLLHSGVIRSEWSWTIYCLGVSIHLLPMSSFSFHKPNVIMYHFNIKYLLILDVCVRSEILWEAVAEVAMKRCLHGD